MKNQKAFTLIELIVVIAIIAILAAIVVVGVVGYINKSKIAAIKADMATLKTAAAIYFSEHGEYDNVCDSTTFNSAKAAINKINNGITSRQVWCVDSSISPTDYCSGEGWVAQAPLLSDSTFWCIDYLGSSMVGVESGNSPPPCTCSHLFVEP